MANQYYVTIDDGERVQFDQLQTQLMGSIIIGGRGRLLDNLIALVNDGSLHKLDIYLVTDAPMTGVDTTGIKPFMSYSAVLFVGTYKQLDANNFSHDVSFTIAKQ